MVYIRISDDPTYARAEERHFLPTHSTARFLRRIRHMPNTERELKRCTRAYREKEGASNELFSLQLVDLKDLVNRLLFVPIFDLIERAMRKMVLQENVFNI